MDGHPKDAATFARVSGYVEQVSPLIELINVLEQARTLKHRETVKPANIVGSKELHAGC